MENEISVEQRVCRVCRGGLREVFNLGNLYPSNFTDDGRGIPPQPLALVECNRCRLVQLKYTIDLDLMYKDHYWYRSSLNQSMVKHLQDLAIRARMEADLQEGDWVLDIGCNDGTLLSFYSDRVTKVGFEPAQNLAELAIPHCNVFVGDYFDLSSRPFMFMRNQFKIITSIAMFYDLPNPLSFIKDIKDSLSYEGIWIIQFQDLVSMMKCNALDNICHEHLEYYTIENIKYMIQIFDLEIFDIEYNYINGGSIRLYICHKDEYEKRDSVDKFLFREESYLSNNDMVGFINRIYTEKNKLLELVERIKQSNEKIYVLGASTKGNTLLQYYGLNNHHIDKALEINEDKFGLRTVGSNIPIIAEDVGLAEKPEYLLVLPWHYRDFFINKMTDYIKSGGRLIFPLPTVNVIGSENL